jgi:hypothetical protein
MYNIKCHVIRTEAQETQTMQLFFIPFFYFSAHHFSTLAMALQTVSAFEESIEFCTRALEYYERVRVRKESKVNTLCI